MADITALSTRKMQSRTRRAWTLAAAALVVCTGLGAARPAQARLFILSGSVGYGHEFYPDQAEQATNIMITPGITLLADILRFELGVLGAYGAVAGNRPNDFDIELRPMLRAKIPLVPVYGRVILAGVDLFSEERALAYGGAVGMALSLFGVGIFGEVGVLPRHIADGFHWIAEGRLGASYAF